MFSDKNMQNANTSQNIRKRQRSSGPDHSLKKITRRNSKPNDSDEYIFTDKSYRSQIISSFSKLHQNDELCDVVLLLQNTKLKVHKNILIAFSPYFKAMFENECVESKRNIVQLKSIDINVMKLLLNYAYTGRITVTTSNCESIISTSNFLQVIPVRNAACEFLGNHLDASNCLGIHSYAESHACEELVQKTANFIIEKFEQVVQNDEFLELTSDRLIKVINSDKLTCEKQDQVFLAVMRWFNHKSKTRGQDLCEILKTVKLHLVDPYLLCNCTSLFPVLNDFLECLNIIDAAISNLTELIVAVSRRDNPEYLPFVECFCPTSNMWYNFSHLPQINSAYGLAVFGKYLYVAGGDQRSKILNIVWRYDTVFDVWKKMAPMLVPRVELGLAALGSYIYAVGGSKGYSELDSAERYDPGTDTWSFIQKLKKAVTNASVIVQNEMLYVFGETSSRDLSQINCFQRYDPGTGTWTELKQPKFGRIGAVSCVLGEFIYLLGGFCSRQVERYDTKSDQWEEMPPMNEDRYFPEAAVINEKIYVMGGSVGNINYLNKQHHYDTIEYYTPETNCWKIVDKLPSPGPRLSCVPLKINNEVLQRKTKKIIRCRRILIFGTYTKSSYFTGG